MKKIIAMGLVIGLVVGLVEPVYSLAPRSGFGTRGLVDEFTRELFIMFVDLINSKSTVTERIDLYRDINIYLARVGFLAPCIESLGIRRFTEIERETGFVCQRKLLSAALYSGEDYDRMDAIGKLYGFTWRDVYRVKKRVDGLRYRGKTVKKIISDIIDGKGAGAPAGRFIPIEEVQLAGAPEWLVAKTLAVIDIVPPELLSGNLPLDIDDQQRQIKERVRDLLEKILRQLKEDCGGTKNKKRKHYCYLYLFLNGLIPFCLQNGIFSAGELIEFTESLGFSMPESLRELCEMVAFPLPISKPERDELFKDLPVTGEAIKEAGKIGKGRYSSTDARSVNEVIIRELAGIIFPPVPEEGAGKMAGTDLSEKAIKGLFSHAMGGRLSRGRKLGRDIYWEYRDIKDRFKRLQEYTGNLRRMRDELGLSEEQCLRLQRILLGEDETVNIYFCSSRALMDENGFIHDSVWQRRGNLNRWGREEIDIVTAGSRIFEKGQPREEIDLVTEQAVLHDILEAVIGIKHIRCNRLELLLEKGPAVMDKNANLFPSRRHINALWRYIYNIRSIINGYLSLKQPVRFIDGYEKKDAKRVRIAREFLMDKAFKEHRYDTNRKYQANALAGLLFVDDEVNVEELARRILKDYNLDSINILWANLREVELYFNERSLKMPDFYRRLGRLLDILAEEVKKKYKRGVGGVSGTRPFIDEWDTGRAV